MKKWIKKNLWRIMGINSILNTIDTDINRIMDIQKEHKKQLDELLKSTREIVKAEIFNNSIKDCQWIKFNSFSPGHWAIDYGCLYTLFKVLNDMKPVNILEFGLGQSSKLIHQYAAYNSGVTAVTYEHDKDWITYFKKSMVGNYYINIQLTELQKVEYKGQKTLSYSNNCEELKNNKYDLIMIDAPFGSPRFSRPQILNIIPNCLSKSFCIIIDDYNRPGEQETIQELQSILLDKDIRTLKAVYHSSKDHCLICSENNKFLTTL